jgi:hypothetical protein
MPLRALLPLLTLASCGPTITPSFDSPEPAARNAAIVKAADSLDASKVPDLVRMLDSDDPATRLLAINSLERITGETLGYDYAAPEYERQAAVDRWQKRVQADKAAAGTVGDASTCQGVEGFGGVPHE